MMIYPIMHSLTTIASTKRRIRAALSPSSSEYKMLTSFLYSRRKASGDIGLASSSMFVPSAPSKHLFILLIKQIGVVVRRLLPLGHYRLEHFGVDSGSNTLH